MNPLNKVKTIISKPKRIKSIISYILIFCILIEVPIINFGCYSYYSLNDNKNKAKSLKEYKRTKFILKDDSEVNALSKNCFLFDKDTALYYGAGLLYHGKEIKPNNFEGFINKRNIDSITFINSKPNPHDLYWLKDNDMLKIDENKIIDLSKTNGTQRWLVKDNSGELQVIFSKDINEIQIQKINKLNTSLFVGSIILFYVLLYFLTKGVRDVSHINLGYY